MTPDDKDRIGKWWYDSGARTPEEAEMLKTLTCLVVGVPLGFVFILGVFIGAVIWT